MKVAFGSLIRNLVRRISELPGPVGGFRSGEETIILPDEIDEEERDRIIEKAAQEIVKRGLTAPALLFIEMAKPINFLGSQLLVAVDPFVSSILSSGDYRKFSILMEDDENVERLLQAIERLSGRGNKDG
ncbi:hypothetical protein J7M22_02500 [Candidatus Poribacteria bacterium]|nr:hypothetical protein [Candidatus Poribacteria bacterium]